MTVKEIPPRSAQPVISTRFWREDSQSEKERQEKQKKKRECSKKKRNSKDEDEESGDAGVLAEESDHFAEPSSDSVALSPTKLEEHNEEGRSSDSSLENRSFW